MRKITATGGSWGYSVWALPDRTHKVAYLTQEQYDDFAIARNGKGDAPGRPSDDAVFMLASGGLPIFDTPDGKPHRGDVWDNDGEIVTFTGESPSWKYSHTQADDPGTGQTSKLTGWEMEAVNHVMGLPKVLPEPSFAAREIEELIPNHHSVTYDTSAISNQSFGTSITFAVTVAAQSDRYIVVGTQARQVQPATVTYAGNGLTGLTTSTVDPYSGDTWVQIWGAIAPTTGANNVVVSWTGNRSAHAAALSAYGVDQSTPTTDTDTTTGTSTAPAVTLSSAADELVFTMVGWYSGGGITNTPDATWTAMTAGDPSGFAGGQGAYKTGAASITRTDTLSGTPTGWVMAGVALKAASGGGGGGAISALNGVTYSGISAVDGTTLSGVSHINSIAV